MEKLTLTASEIWDIEAIVAGCDGATLITVYYSNAGVLTVEIDGKIVSPS